jgi:hypothetical protein
MVTQFFTILNWISSSCCHHGRREDVDATPWLRGEPLNKLQDNQNLISNLVVAADIIVLG